MEKTGGKGTTEREGRTAGPLQKCPQPRERERFGLNRLPGEYPSTQPGLVSSTAAESRSQLPPGSHPAPHGHSRPPPRPIPYLTHGPPAAAAIFPRASQPRPHTLRPRDRDPPDWGRGFHHAFGGRGQVGAVKMALPWCAMSPRWRRWNP